MQLLSYSSQIPCPDSSSFLPFFYYKWGGDVVAVAGSVVIFVLMHDSCMLSMAIYWIHAIVSFQVDLND